MFSYRLSTQVEMQPEVFSTIKLKSRFTGKAEKNNDLTSSHLTNLPINYTLQCNNLKRSKDTSLFALLHFSVSMNYLHI